MIHFMQDQVHPMVNASGLPGLRKFFIIGSVSMECILDVRSRDMRRAREDVGLSEIGFEDPANQFNH